ncbi:anti-sigma factor [Asanoa sp. WMMD1127]|uniref:anti-sigma factor n=1 Tax=Asanoa sp. WMMD1127 TaxID=3016107 RepID=UPI002417B6B4|nr:anti-sigma factor [Asanoa sp. WMMD1127]MDG4821391.1 anti-sigma factor [Asanoa sp. WMMD1127]
MSGEDVHALSGAYVLDGLTDIERAAFRRHLASCATCAIEVAELQETAARLADGAWSVPPPALRDKVFAEVSRTRQEAPIPAKPVARPQRSRRLVTAAAAVLLAAAAATGTFAVQERRLDEQRVQAQAESARITEVLAAPDAVLRSATLTSGGRLTAVTSATRDETVLTLTADRPAGADRTYQLWMLDGTTATNAGVLAPDVTTTTQLISGTAAADGFAVSIEPAGGSPTPTQPVGQVTVA